MCSGVSSIENLVNCIDNGATDYQSAVPIAYTLRFLHDNSVARVVLANEYTARQCELRSSSTTQDINFRIKRMRTSGEQEFGFIGDHDLELFGKIGLRATAEDTGDNAGACTWNGSATPSTLAGTAAADIYNRDNGLIFDRQSSGEHVQILNNWVDVSNLNFSRTVTLDRSSSPAKTNLSVCGALVDHDHILGGGNDSFNSRSVIDPNISPGNVVVVRIGRGSIWADIELERIP